MEVEPAHIDQLRRAAGGKFVEIHKDVGGVVDDLKRIDPGFGVRFAEDGRPPYWHVYHREGNTTDLVMSVQAHQNSSGVWEGLDQRVVARVLKIGHSSYDYTAELERNNRQVDAERRSRLHEQIGEHAEAATHAIRKDLGTTHRAFIPKSL